MYVNERFKLDQKIKHKLLDITPNFGFNGLGEATYYRTYSRQILNEHEEQVGQEHFHDTAFRVIEGTFSIRKDWYKKNGIAWYDSYWQEYALKFGQSMIRMEWLPPGRGMWAMGSNFIYERGSMSLYNCAWTEIGENFEDDFHWFMDCLMLGVGVGFTPLRTSDSFRLYEPVGSYDFVIEDSREGWIDSVRALLRAIRLPNQPMPRMIYDLIRPAGLLIKGFGGISSGPGPLRFLHQQILDFARTITDELLFKANVGNAIGCCVVAGNVRRSAEIMLGRPNDPIFMDLKDYTKFPEREAFGWMSNNSVILDDREDFACLGEIAKRVIKNGEPGYVNRRNFPHGRIGKFNDYPLRKDKAKGINPCGEIPLEDKETCNVVETCPTACETPEQWYTACQHATTYASTVSLLPTHRPETNRVVARNRRIGVSMFDFANWKQSHGVHKITAYMREGYNAIRAKNRELADEAGVPESIRVTTVKPGGTIPKLPGRVSGIGNPTFNHTMRRMRVPINNAIHPYLVKAGYRYERDYYEKMHSGEHLTDVFDFPIIQNGKPATEVTLWEQAMTLMLVQREWADNAVANTLYFKPMWPLIEYIIEDFQDRIEEYFGVVATRHFIYGTDPEMEMPERYKVRARRDSDGEIVEAWIHEFNPKHEENDIEPVLSMIAPMTKSVSLLPHSADGAYKQMPESGITEAQYYAELAKITPIDWSTFGNSDGLDERYCSGPACEVTNG